MLIFLYLQQLRWKSETREKKEGKIPTKQEVKRDLFENPLAEYHAAPTQPHKGQIYDKKPFKFPVEEGKLYMWCACGHSKSQVVILSWINVMSYSQMMLFHAVLSSHSVINLTTFHIWKWKFNQFCIRLPRIETFGSATASKQSILLSVMELINLLMWKKLWGHKPANAYQSFPRMLFHGSCESGEQNIGVGRTATFLEHCAFSAVYIVILFCCHCYMNEMPRIQQ